MEVALLIFGYVILVLLIIFGDRLITGNGKGIRHIVGWIMILVAVGAAIGYYVAFPDYRTNRQTLSNILEVISGLVVLLHFIGKKGGKKDE